MDNSGILYIKNGEMMPLGHIEEVDLTVDSDVNDIPKGFWSSESIELNLVSKDKLRTYALGILLCTGNAFYMKFPKKLIRKLRRINRTNRRNLLRSSL